MDVAVQKLATEPAGATYRALLNAAQSVCDKALLVVRPSSLTLGDDGKRVLTQLSKFLIADSDANEWPGTRLLRGTARVLTYHLVPESHRILTTATDRLFAWRQPELPEDLALLRSDASPWLFSISHEEEAYLALTTAKRESLSKSSREISKVLGG